MKIKELKKRPDFNTNKKLFSAYAQLGECIMQLNKRELTDDIINSINKEIDQIHSISESEKELLKQIRKSQSKILKLIEKTLKIVTKNHYRNTWLAIGMAVFGIPLGVTFGLTLGNIGLLGIGLPIGMVIGMVVGSNLDKKALQEGRQLDMEIKF